MGAWLDQWLETEYPDPDERSRMAAALLQVDPIEQAGPQPEPTMEEIAAELAPDRLLDEALAGTLAPPIDVEIPQGPGYRDYAGLTQKQRELQEKAAKEREAAGPVAQRVYKGEPRGIEDRTPEAEQRRFDALTAAQREIVNARRIGEGLRPLEASLEGALARIGLDPGGNPLAGPPPAPAGGGFGVSVSSRGPTAASEAVLGEVRKEYARGKQDRGESLDAITSAANDLIGAERVKAEVQATIEENQRPFIEARLANDLYEQSLQTDLIEKHAEIMQKGQEALNSRIAAYASKKIQPMDAGFAGTIGVILGGLGAAIRADGGPNRVLALLERHIERDIDKQKFEWQQEGQAIGFEGASLGRQETMFQNELTRRRVMRAERWTRAGQAIEAEARRYGAQIGEANLEATIAGIKQKAIVEADGVMRAYSAISQGNLALQLKATTHREDIAARFKLAESGGGPPLQPMTGETLEKLGSMIGAKGQIGSMAKDFQNLDWTAAFMKWFPGSDAQGYKARLDVDSLLFAFALSGMQLPPEQEKHIRALFADPGAFKATADSKFTALLGALDARIHGIVAANRMGGRDTRLFDAAGYGQLAKPPVPERKR